jgi:hypothetical protein
MISQAIFNVARSVESTLHQCLEPGLTSGASNRTDKSVPLRDDFRVLRKARNINQAFCLRNRLFVKGSDPQRQGFDEGIKVGVRESPIDVAVPFGQIAWNIVRPEQQF